MSSRCTAKTFHRGRCRNQATRDDPAFCHIHSPRHLRCLATHARNGRPCLRKPVEGSRFCQHHRERTVGELSGRERHELMSGSTPIDPRLESASGPYAHLGTVTGRFRA